METNLVTHNTLQRHQSGGEFNVNNPVIVRPSKKRKANDAYETILKFLESKNEFDADVAFGNLVVAELNKLEETKKNKMKLTILNILYNANAETTKTPMEQITQPDQSPSAGSFTTIPLAVRNAADYNYQMRYTPNYMTNVPNTFIIKPNYNEAQDLSLTPNHDLKHQH